MPLTAPFLGLNFAPFTLEDGRVLAPFLRRHGQPLSGYTFAALFAWARPLTYRWAFAGEDTLFISCCNTDDRTCHLLQPVGSFGPDVQAMVLREAAARAWPLRMVAVSRRFLQAHPEFVARCEVQEDRNEFNYLYRAEDLATLPGRRYSAKRNFIAQAARAYTHTVEPFTPASSADAFHVLEQLGAENWSDGDRWLIAEREALETTLTAFDELGQAGILVRVGGEPAGFSLYEELEPGTAVIHFERALRRFKGLHQVVAREGARAVRAAGFELLNREEDLGNEGLRQAKLSYHPVELVEAFTLTLR